MTVVFARPEYRKQCIKLVDDGGSWWFGRLGFCGWCGAGVFVCVLVEDNVLQSDVVSLADLLGAELNDCIA